MRHDLSELSEVAPTIQVLVRRPELDKFSPGTLALLEFRDERDRDILLKMYGLQSGQAPRKLLGDHGPDTWEITHAREYHMSDDRDLWTHPAGRLWTPKEVCGLDWPGSAPWQTVRVRMAERGFWPLYEGKLIEQFLTDIKPVTRWVSLERAATKYGSLPSNELKLVYRRVARNTDERTCIAAILPVGSCANDKLPVLRAEHCPLEHVCTVLNSLTFDFAVRLRVGLQVDFTHVSRLAVPSPGEARMIVPQHTLSGGGIERKSLVDRDELFQSLWETESSVLRAYGLGPFDFEHILTSFPLFAKKRPRFHAFLLERLAEWKAEEG